MADRDPAGEAQRRGPLRDQAQLPGPERPRIVQVNIDADAAPLGEAEDDIEMPFRIAVDARRVEAADEVGAVP